MGKGTIFYVHGSGNREEAATAYAAQLRAGLGLPVGSDKLTRSIWGVAKGPDPTFPLVDSVLPPLPQGLGDPDAELAAEHALAPLAALAPPAGIGTEVDAPPKPDDIGALLAAVRSGTLDLSAYGISQPSLSAAADEVTASVEFQAAVAPTDSLFDATLTSIIARALEIELAAQPAELAGISPADIPGAIVGALGSVAHQILGSATSAITGFVGPKLSAAVLLALSKRAAISRNEVMKASGFLVPWDVLFYQRRGKEIREHLRGELAVLERPVVAIGHSLGGIILVDTLFGPEVANGADVDVDLLVTFGSQSAMLAAIGAIDSVTPTIPWINIWTRYDFISFLAGQIWPGATDVEVPIEVGFPESHGAYYTTSAFFDRLKDQPLVQGILG